MLKSKTQIVKLFTPEHPLKLESGDVLTEVRVAFETYGRLNRTSDNAVLVCHALTGDAHAAGFTEIDDQILDQIPLYGSKKPNQPGWWDGLIGPGKTIDTERFFVVCSNILGSCYGTTGPNSIDPESGKPYGPNFPEITVRDMIKVQKRLLEYLRVQKLVTVIGGSLGGMQTLEWALMYPETVKSVISIAAAARHSAWAIGFNHLARQAIKNDPLWNNGYYRQQPENGLALARQIGMVSYRTDISFQRRFGREKQNNGQPGQFKVESYLSYQGDKLVKRFDANSMITLTKAMDRHDVGFNRGGVKKALSSIKAKALCIGIDTDILYPAIEQKEIADHIPNGVYREIKSPDGHDAFLIEFDQLNAIINEFLGEI
ncbi:MAG: homoserine O-acetyltransferase [Calditrichaeota bacterium]|nr:homoserine O-acetyltransferase [Calditrichota bacterium]